MGDTAVYINVNEFRENDAPIPLPEQLNDRSLLEALISNTKDFGLNDGFDTSKSVTELSDEVLKIRAYNVITAAQNNPDYRVALMDGARLNEISNSWAQRAATSADETGSTLTKFYAEAANEELSTGRAMMQNALTKEEFLLGTAKFARAAGKMFGFLGLVLSVGEGLYTGLADDTFKGIFSTLVGAAAGWALAGATGLALLTGWEFVAVAALVATFAFAAGKVGDAIWDYALGDIVWTQLDQMGVGDGIRQGFANAREYLFGGRGEPTEDFPVKLVSGGVYQVSDDEVHAYGTSGNDVFKTDWGRGVFLGGAGMDTYEFTTGNLRGAQSVVDSDGSGKVIIDGIEIQQVQTRRLSEKVWISLDSKFRFTLVEINGNQNLVITVTAHGDNVVINNWQDGNLGISLGGSIPETATAAMTEGEDVFGASGSNNGNDAVAGGGGNDGLEGGAGEDHLDGGSGRDLILGGAGNDVLKGGDGDDFIYDGSEQADLRELSTQTNPDTGKSELDRFDEMVASLGNSLLALGKSWYVSDDLIYAPGWTNLDPNLHPSGDDFIDAGAGNDRVYAGEGRDTLLGGDGQDYLSGGADDDVILGGNGDDTIDGDYYAGSGAQGNGLSLRISDAADRNGNDLIDGGSGKDVIRGSGGNDTIFGGDDDDQLFGRGSNEAADPDDSDADDIDGGAGNDQISGDDGADRLSGGEGNDIIRGDNSLAITSHGNDFIDAGAGDDLVSGDGANDIILGGSGNDTLLGDAGNIDGALHGMDTIFGGSGNDIIDGGGGNDALYGEDGDDQIVGDVAVNETLATALHGDDYIDGGSGNDLLIGNGGKDHLIGGAGLDELQGGDGNDLLEGGDDNDILYGEAGDDVLDGGSGDDTLYGGAGDDRLSGRGGVDILAGGDGNDILDGGDGNDILDGEAGNDTINGGAGNDTIDGDDGNDIIYAGIGDDSVYGGAGNDTMLGEAGNDTLTGAGGDDKLTGGAGNDSLTGGGGNDTYYFELGFGQDSVYSLDAADAGTDVFMLGSGITPNNILSTINASGTLVLASTDTADRITLYGFFNNPNAGHSIIFADGTIWTQQSMIENLSNGSTASQTITGANTDASGWSPSNDTLVGALGADTISGGAGADALYGLGGNDILHGDGPSNYVNFINNDYLFGGDGDDWLYGEFGDDVLQGGKGDDFLSGGAGANVYRFTIGDGSDAISIDWGTSATIEFSSGISVEDVLMSRGESGIFIYYGADTIRVPLDLRPNSGEVRGLSIKFSDGTILTKDQIVLMAKRPTEGDDVIDGSETNDIIYGLGGRDVLNGLGGDDQIEGGEGNDTIIGGNGNDVLSGGAGDDTIYGEYTNDFSPGNDVLDGGIGNDYLQGEAGQDTYVFGRGYGVDRVNDQEGPSVLRIGSGVASTDLIFTAPQDYNGYQNSILISIVGTQDSISFYFNTADQSTAESLPFSRIEFDDGTFWDEDAIRQVVDDAIALGSNSDGVALSADEQAFGYIESNNISESKTNIEIKARASSGIDVARFRNFGSHGKTIGWPDGRFAENEPSTSARPKMSNSSHLQNYAIEAPSIYKAMSPHGSAMSVATINHCQQLIAMMAIGEPNPHIFSMSANERPYLFIP